MMIRPVGGTNPRRVRAPVSTIAVAPTVLEMAGIEAPEAMEERSLLPLVYGNKEAGFVFAESGYHIDYMLSVRDSKWKLIHVPN
jgi:arylsulfatase A-like enzyme